MMMEKGVLKIARVGVIHVRSGTSGAFTVGQCWEEQVEGLWEGLATAALKSPCLADAVLGRVRRRTFHAHSVTRNKCCNFVCFTGVRRVVGLGTAAEKGQAALPGLLQHSEGS